MTRQQQEPDREGSRGPRVRVRRNEATHRFEAELDAAPAGFVDYRQRGDEFTLIHTRTLAGFEGRGVGSMLARSALEEVRRRGGKAVVSCPFIRAYLRKHPGEYDDVVRRA
jgi:predicted GNAT family acetyltransferase